MIESESTSIEWPLATFKLSRLDLNIISILASSDLLTKIKLAEQPKSTTPIITIKNFRQTL